MHAACATRGTDVPTPPLLPFTPLRVSTHPLSSPLPSPLLSSPHMLSAPPISPPSRLLTHMSSLLYNPLPISSPLINNLSSFNPLSPSRLLSSTPSLLLSSPQILTLSPLLSFPLLPSPPLLLSSWCCRCSEPTKPRLVLQKYPIFKRGEKNNQRAGLIL